MSGFLRDQPLITIDGEDITGHVVSCEMTAHMVMADGSRRAHPGSCPECARVPIVGAVVCPHGVALP